MMQTLRKKALTILMLFVIICLAITSIGVGILFKGNSANSEPVADRAVGTDISKTVNANVGLHYRWTTAKTEYNNQSGNPHVQRDSEGMPLYERATKAAKTFEINGSDPVQAYKDWIAATDYATDKSFGTTSFDIHTTPITTCSVTGSYVANEYVYVKLTSDWKANYWTSATTTTTSTSAANINKFKAATLTDDLATSDVLAKSFYYDINKRYLKYSDYRSDVFDSKAPKGFSFGRINVPRGAYIVLDLNGHTIDRDIQTQFEFGSVIAVEAFARLEIMDSTAYQTADSSYLTKKADNTAAGNSSAEYSSNHKGKITGGYCYKNKFNNEGKGGGVHVFPYADCVLHSGTVTGNTGYLGGFIYCVSYAGFLQYDGYIAGNYAINGNGGGVYMAQGSRATYTMYAGSVSYNKANYGGGVTLYDSSYGYILGGQINHNSASQTGGGVYIGIGSQGIMQNCTITNNNATTNGGGVFVQLPNEDNASLIKFLGSIHIENNTKGGSSKNNVYISTGAQMIIGGRLLSNGESARIGVTLQSGTGVFTQGYNAKATKFNSSRPTMYFFADDSTKAITWDNSNTEAQVVNKSTISNETRSLDWTIKGIDQEGKPYTHNLPTSQTLFEFYYSDYVLTEITAVDPLDNATVFSWNSGKPNNISTSFYSWMNTNMENAMKVDNAGKYAFAIKNSTSIVYDNPSLTIQVKQMGLEVSLINNMGQVYYGGANALHNIGIRDGVNTADVEIVFKSLLRNGTYLEHIFDPKVLGFDIIKGDKVAVSSNGSATVSIANAGEYYLKCTFVTDTFNEVANNFTFNNDGSDKSFSFTILPAEIKVDSNKNQLVFNNSSQNPTVFELVNGCLPSILDTDYYFSTDQAGKVKKDVKNAGDYLVYLQLSDNFVIVDDSGSSVSNWEVPMFNVERMSIDLPTNNNFEHIYDGTEYTYLPNGFDDVMMSISGNTGKNVDNYTATVSPTANYKWNVAKEGSNVYDLTFNWNIKKRDITIKVGETSSAFGDEIDEIAYEIGGLGLAAGEEAKDIFALSTTATKNSVVGKYDVTCENKSDNYNISLVNNKQAYSIVKAKIVDGNGDWSTFYFLYDTNSSYGVDLNGKVFGFAGGYTINDAKIYYKNFVAPEGAKDYVWNPDSNGNSKNSPSISDYGTYTVTLVIEADNHETFEKNLTLIISEAVISVGLKGDPIKITYGESVPTRAQLLELLFATDASGNYLMVDYVTGFNDASGKDAIAKLKDLIVQGSIIIYVDKGDSNGHTEISGNRADASSSNNIYWLHIGVNNSNNSMQIKYANNTNKGMFVIEQRAVDVVWDGKNYDYNGVDQIDKIKAKYVDVEGKDVLLEITTDINGGVFKDWVSGGYTFTANAPSDGNYKLSGVNTTSKYSINKKAITYGWEYADGGYTYNGKPQGPIGKTTINGENGEVLNFTISAPYTNVGNGYILTATFDSVSGGSMTNYDVSGLQCNAYDIKAFEIKIIWSENFIYNGTNQLRDVQAYYNDVDGKAIMLNVTGESGEFKNYKDGGYKFTASLANSETNYKLPEVVDKILQMQKRSVHLVADDNSMVYGDKIPALSWKYHDNNKMIFVETDDITLNVTTTATSTSNVGDYETVIEKRDDLINYDITYDNGKFTITERELTVKATGNLSSVYGDEIGTIGYTLTSGVIVNGDEGVFELITTATNTSNVSNYDIEIKLNNKNYIVTIENGKGSYSITPKNVEMTFDSEESYIYSVDGQELPTAYFTDISGGKYLLTVTEKDGKEFKNVGEYTFLASLGADEINYIVTNITDTLTLTIVKRQITKPLESVDEFVYNGVVQEYTPVNYDSLYMTMTNGEQSNADTYTVTVSLADKDNCEWVGGTQEDFTFTWIIAKADLTLQVTVSDWTYGDKANEPNIISNVAVAGMNLTYLYTGTTLSGVKYESALAPTDAGEYKLYISADDTSNYSAANAESDIFRVLTRLLTKEDFEIIWADNFDGVYDGNIHSVIVSGTYSNDVEFSVDGELKNADSYIVSVTVNNPNVKIDGTLDYEIIIQKAKVTQPTANDQEFIYNGDTQEYLPIGFNADTMSISGNTGVNANNYRATVSLKDSDNYEWDNGTIDNIIFNWAISKMKVARPTANEQEYVYNGVAQQYLPIGFDADTMSISDGTKTNADVYKATVSLKNSANYDWEDGTNGNIIFDWTIEKAELQIKVNDISLVYGDDVPTYSVTTTGFVGSDNDNVLSGIIRFESDYVKNSKVGNYPVKAEGLSADNYNISYIDGTVTVSPREITITWETEDYVYTGGKLDFPNADTGYDVVVTVTEKDGKKFVDVGDYNFVASINNPNFILKNAPTCSVSIKQAENTWLSNLVMKNWTYGEPSNKPNVLVKFGEVTYIIKDSKGKEVSLDGIVNAGTYTVEARVAGTNNYKELIHEPVEFTVHKAIYDVSKIKFEDATVKYDGKAKSLVISGTLPNGLTVTYVYTLNGKTVDSAVQAGEYTVTAKFTGDSDNYELVGDMVAKLTITLVKVNWWAIIIPCIAVLFLILLVLIIIFIIKKRDDDSDDQSKRRVQEQDSFDLYQ